MKTNENKAAIDHQSYLQRIAQMYYVLGMTQQEISDKLDIGRSSVTRYLKEARDAGIVEIRVHSSSEYVRRLDLENSLGEKFSLKDVVVIDAEDPTLLMTISASYIESMLPVQGDVVIGGGKTMGDIGNILPGSIDRSRLNIVQGTGIIYEGTTSTSVAEIWSRRLRSRHYYLSAPGITGSQETREILRSDPIILPTVERYRNADMFFTSVGSIRNSLERAKAFPGIYSVLESVKDQAVGDFSFHFYDRDGNFILPEFDARNVGISLDEFFSIKTRVCVAYGIEKAPAIRAAIGHDMFHILITDTAAAEKVLND